MRIRVPLCFGIWLIFWLSAASAHALPTYAIVRSAAFSRLPVLASQKCLDGVTLYFSWRELEPEPSIYNFDLLDRAVAARGRLALNIAVLPGRWSPDWLRKQGVPYMGWHHRDSYVEDGRGRDASAPVPWDQRYLDRFKSFISELQAHVERKGYPIEAIAVTGPSNTNGLEIALIASDAELERAGFDRAAYIAAWRGMIDVFGRFPNSMKVTLALHDQIGGRRRTDIAHAVSEYARAKLGNRYVPMLLAFEAKPWFHDSNQYAGMVLKGGSASGGALQAIRIFSASQKQDEFAATLRSARDLQPQWLEIWQEDVRSGYLDCE